MARLILAAGAAALMTVPAAADAASYTDTYTFGSVIFTGNFISESYMFDGFDSSLGTLQSVTFDFGSSFQTEYRFDAFAGQTVNYQTNGGVTVYYDGTFADFSGTTTDTATFDGNLVTLGAVASGTRTFTDNFARFTDSTVRLQFGVPQLFFGGTQVFPNGQSTVLSQSSTLAVTFTYLDQAGAVPEPATWASMIAGLALVGVGARRRRAMVPV